MEIISSDSEEDCYGNVAQKLQKMKNKYVLDNIETSNLLNNSIELCETLEKSGDELKNKTCSAIHQGTVQDSVIQCMENSAVVKPPTRITRSSTRNNNINENTLETPSQTTRTRRKNIPPQTHGNEIAQTIVSTPRGRASARRPRGGRRGRGRGRGRGQRRRQESYIPCYSVGNTDEYYDECDNIQLFSNKTTDNDVEIVEDTDLNLSENEEMSVKVYWRSSDFFKFTIRRFQKLSHIFNYFSEKENVSTDKILLTYNDTILVADDTPDTINYNIVKFIEGGIINESIKNLKQVRNTTGVDVTQSSNIKNGVKLKFQSQIMKRPFELIVDADDKLLRAMVKCAEHLERPLHKLKFEFDGDCISGKLTPRELELEGGECIDVKIHS